MDNKFSAVILAAGMGTRMKSTLPKVLHKICAKPIAEWVIDAARQAGAEEICTVVGHGFEQVEKALEGKSSFVLQKEQKGTGHAVLQAADFIKNGRDITIVLCGDTPLITAKAIEDAVNLHIKEANAVTVVSAIVKDAFGYGRIVRDTDGSVIKIVEQKDADEKEQSIHEINSGIYVFSSNQLLDALLKLTPNNAQGEYYLTDTLSIIKSAGNRVGAYTVSCCDDILGINDRVQLSIAEKIMQERIRRMHMLSGVTMTQPENVVIEENVEIGQDTFIDGAAFLKSGTKIGTGAFIGYGCVIENSEIGNNARVCASNIKNSKLGDGTDVLNSVLDSAQVEADTHVGPFAYLRPKSHIGKGCRVGDFVEVKNSNIGDGTKISHLTYVGDSDVGERVNFGCGTVTSNYDGKNKFRTVIGDDCFIGCNTNLVAPVSVENGAYIAAGSTITDTVPENSLAIARSRQVNKTGWTDKRKKSE